MVESYPYIVSNNKIEPILAKVSISSSTRTFHARNAKQMGIYGLKRPRDGGSPEGTWLLN